MGRAETPRTLTSLMEQMARLVSEGDEGEVTLHRNLIIAAFAAQVSVA